MNIFHVFRTVLENSPFNSNFIATRSMKRCLKNVVKHTKGLTLDVGCGEKPYKQIFESHVETYIGIDLPHDVYHFSKLSADIIGNATELAIKSEVFDTVLCVGVLPHIPEPHVAFTEFFRVLKPGGVLILTAGKSWLKREGLSIGDYWRFTDDGLVWLAQEQNLEVVSIKPACGFIAMLGLLASRFLSNEFIYLNAFQKSRARKPSVIGLFCVLPLCALVQVLCLFFDKIYYSKIDTLFYCLVAQKKLR